MRIKTMAVAATLGAALALSGPARAADPDPAKQQQEQLTQGSAGYQDGQVAKLEGNTLMLEPYQKEAGTAQLQANPDTKVFAVIPNGLVSSGLGNAVLNPGANVRVYYKPGPNESQQIVAVELLPMDEARRIQASHAK